MDLTKFAEELKVLAKSNSIPYYTTDLELIELFHRQYENKNDKYSIGRSNKCINTVDSVLYIR